MQTNLEQIIKEVQTEDLSNQTKTVRESKPIKLEIIKDFQYPRLVFKMFKNLSQTYKYIDQYMISQHPTVDVPNYTQYPATAIRLQSLTKGDKIVLEAGEYIIKLTLI